MFFGLNLSSLSPDFQILFGYLPIIFIKLNSIKCSFRAHMLPSKPIFHHLCSSNVFHAKSSCFFLGITSCFVTKYYVAPVFILEYGHVTCSSIDFMKGI